MCVCGLASLWSGICCCALVLGQLYPVMNMSDVTQGRGTCEVSTHTQTHKYTLMI